MVKPKYAIPIHGEYRHRKANAGIAEALGIPKENIFMIQSGDVLAIDQNEAKLVDKVQTGSILVDGLGVGDVGNIVLRDRQHLAEDGIMIVVVTIDHETYQVVSGPDIVSRGFVYVREAEDLMESMREKASIVLDDCLSHNTLDWASLKSHLKNELSGFIFSKTKRKPMILPVIINV